MKKRISHKQAIRRIANDVRRWSKLAVSTEWGSCYGQNLSGFCTHSAIELFRRLLRAGYKPQLALAADSGKWEDHSWGHCFVLCEDLVVDVTASQFLQPHVVVRSARASKTKWFWRPLKTYQSISGLRRRLIANERGRNVSIPANVRAYLSVPTDVRRFASAKMKEAHS